MEEDTLAMELLIELKQCAKRWFIAFCVMVILEIGTILGFMWYISLPTNDTTISQQQQNGEECTVIGIGDSNGKTNSEAD